MTLSKWWRMKFYKHFELFKKNKSWFIYMQQNLHFYTKQNIDNLNKHYDRIMWMKKSN